MTMAVGLEALWWKVEMGKERACWITCLNVVQRMSDIDRLMLEGSVERIVFE